MLRLVGKICRHLDQQFYLDRNKFGQVVQPWRLKRTTGILEGPAVSNDTTTLFGVIPSKKFVRSISHVKCQGSRTMLYEG